MATGYPEVMEVMRNTDAFSNDAVTFPRYGTTERLMLAGQDDPEHKRARLLVNEPFSPGRVMDFTKMLRENVNALIDGFIESGRADAAKIIGDPIPAILTAIRAGATGRTWTALLQVDVGDVPRILHRSRKRGTQNQGDVRLL